LKKYSLHGRRVHFISNVDPDDAAATLDGLNLSREWCFFGIAGALNKAKDRDPLLEAAREHLRASLPHVASPYYEGSHWLGTFAVYALTSYGR
jgi:hypothetical protein